MGRATLESKLCKDIGKPVDDGLGGHRSAPLGLDDGITSHAVILRSRPLELDQRTTQVRVDGDPATTTLLRSPGGQLDHGADLATGVADHRPGQSAYLASAETGFDTQQDDHRIAVGVAAVSTVSGLMFAPIS